MKSISISILFFCLINQINAQFTDHFSDGDFTNNPTWVGTNTHFEVETSSINYLWLNAPAVNSSSYLVTQFSAIENAEWNFRVRLDFNPSSSNLARIYIMSSDSNLNNSLQGYYVQIGGTEDEVSLFKQIGSAHTKLVDGTDGMVSKNQNILDVKVTRDNNGNFTLYADTNISGTFFLQGTTTDIQIESSKYFGILCTYTSTRSDKFFFDNFLVTGSTPIDTTPPLWSTLNIVSDSSIEIIFSEEVNSFLALNTSNYLLNPTGLQPYQINYSGDKILLFFSPSFTIGTPYNLTISQIEDLSGNITGSTTKNFTYYPIDTAQLREIVFNELMIDPTPTVGLPDIEYIELLNTSNKAFNLKDYQLINTTTPRVLPEFILQPGAYVLLCNTTDVSTLLSYGDAIAINSFVTLVNSDDSLTLLNPLGEIVDIISYKDTWYKDTQKKEGGWSLERIDPYTICTGENNWMASTNTSGGTPGYKNAVYDELADTTAPYITDINIIASNILEFKFSEAFSVDYILQNSDFLIQPYIQITSAYITPENWVRLYLSEPLTVKIIYKLTYSNMKDCFENITNQYTYSFLFPDTATRNDLIINEVLFNPYNTGKDFVEIYNNSDKNIDLKNWQLANISNNTIGTIRNITNQSKILYPNEYVLLTTDSLSTVQLYPSSSNPEVFIIMSSLPAYNNADGTVILLNPDTLVIDSLYYNEKMHHPLLNDVKGISLERISTNRATIGESNWHSAAESVGFATPGTKNSQYLEELIPVEFIEITPTIFSPDNDGIDDIVQIGYTLPDNGFTANIQIFDIQGRSVNKLIENTLVGTKGVFLWSGENEVNKKLEPGIYILYFEFFNPNGVVLKSKKTVTIAYKYH